MEINAYDKSDKSDSYQYESLRGVSLRQLKEAKQARAAHRSLAYRPTSAVSETGSDAVKLRIRKLHKKRYSVESQMRSKEGFRSLYQLSSDFEKEVLCWGSAQSDNLQ